MNGLAKKLFQERSKKAYFEESKKSQWPLLEKMVADKRLGYVDLSMANRFLGQKSITDEAVACFFCHMSLAARKGHLCIKIKDGNIIPSPEEIWVTDEPGHVQENFSQSFEELKACIMKGSAEIPPSLISYADHFQNPFFTPIIKYQNAFYLQRYWHLETIFLTEFKKRIMERHPIKAIDAAVIENRVKQLIEEGKLLKEQAEAVWNASQKAFTLITGGPGTGKTYTAGIILRTIWEALSDVEKKDFTIVLAAPTGKAAANLEESIRKVMNEMEGFPAIKAQTLHQLLGIKRSAFQEFVPLNADLVLIDEGSMIDVKLMGHLFSALKPGSRLIMLGDKHQLASVEAGSLFADLIETFSGSTTMASVVDLKICMRTELKSIIDFAEQVKKGNAEEAFKCMNSAEITWVELNSAKGVREQQERFIQYVIPFFPALNYLPKNPLDLFTHYQSFRILTPLRKGPFGVEALNAIIFQTMKNRMEEKGFFIAPIMILQNDYHMNLFNGEVGIIIRDKEREYALFPSRQPEQPFRQIPGLLIPKYEYAYCLSVHKSQGSEFDHVVLLLSPGTQGFGREALYTGITRAKKRLEIWSQLDIVKQMIAMPSARQSGIVERLRKI